MVVTENTRISELIKENKESIEAIASIAKPLEKLKNPILRKLMASRVTLSEAAKIGNCTIGDFKSVLIPLGFTFLNSDLIDKPTEERNPDWLNNLSKEQIVVFDVRAILANGQDPLKQIIKRFKEIPMGNALCIVNSFVPTPLVRLLEKEGVKSFTKTIDKNEFHTIFFKVLPKESIDQNVEPNLGEKLRMLDQDSFYLEHNKFPASKIREIDVRHLEMPGPMQTILEILPKLDSDEALYVNHKRVPLYLLEELAEEDFCVNILNLSDKDVKLLIYRIS